MSGLTQWFKKAAQNGVAESLEAALGRKLFARVSRYLWRRARLDFPNDFELNGERLVLEGLAGQAAARIGSDAVDGFRVFDVGANVGAWSGQLVELLDREGAAELDLHLFEPAPAAAEQLRAAVGGRKLGKMTLNEVAVADEPGRATLNIKAPTAGSNSLRETAREQVTDEVDVEIVTLDDYCRQRSIDRIDFLKIDTEGNDFNVLLGARELLEAGAIGAAQFEYNWRWVNFRHFLRDVFEFLEPLDYRLGKITPLGVETYREWDFELENFWEGNFLIFHSLESLGLEEVRYWKTS